MNPDVQQIQTVAIATMPCFTARSTHIWDAGTMEGVTTDHLVDSMTSEEETETTVDLTRSNSLLRNYLRVQPILLNLFNNSRLHKAIKEVNNDRSVL
jgi:hypothetical protein